MTREEKINMLNSRCDKCQSCDECGIDNIEDEETFEFIENNNCDFSEMNDEMLNKCYDWLKELELRNGENGALTYNDYDAEPDDLKLHIDQKVARHYAICQRLNAVYKAKNHDYGDSFGDTFKKLGIISAVTRLSDKMNRLMSLAVAHDAQVKDEKIEDTLLDMANYAIMTLIELGYESEN